MSSESSNAEGPAKFWADLSSQSNGLNGWCLDVYNGRCMDNQQE